MYVKLCSYHYHYTKAPPQSASFHLLFLEGKSRTYFFFYEPHEAVARKGTKSLFYGERDSLFEKSPDQSNISPRSREQ